MEMCNYIGKHVSYQIACLPALFTINSLYAPAASLSLGELGARTHTTLICTHAGLYCRLFFLFARAHTRT
jgi:hypothetical protein